MEIIIWLVFGVICAVIANGRGRSAAAWFFIGLLLTCVGLIILLVLPDLKAEQERQRLMAMEQRRLEARVRKDRMVADNRHEASERRLSAHDAALGVDTSHAATSGITGTDPPPPLPLIAGGSSRFASTPWHYATNGRQQGPVTIDTLCALWREKVLSADSLVWSPTMANWQSIGSIPGLQEHLDA